jgi:hypothetical protein
MQHGQPTALLESTSNKISISRGDTAGDTTINFKVVATDNTSASATSPGSGNYIYTVNNLLTDATILGAEFLTLPKTDGVTVNLIASAN